MKAGMMPARSQVPDKAPMSSRIKRASVAVPMLWAMASRMDSQVVPLAIPNAPALNAARSNAIWLDP